MKFGLNSFAWTSLDNFRRTSYGRLGFGKKRLTVSLQFLCKLNSTIDAPHIIAGGLQYKLI